MEKYRIVEHTADVGIVAYGEDLPEAFANAALGMFDQIVELAGLAETATWTVETRAGDLESLLVGWLNDLLFLFDTEGAVPIRIEVEEFGDTHIDAILHGERVSAGRHTLKGEVKAATYHGVEVARGPRAQVQVILDV